MQGKTLAQFPADFGKVEVAKGVTAQSGDNGVSVQGGSLDVSAGGKIKGLRVVLDDVVEQEFSGRTAIIHVSASGKLGSSMRVAYSTNDVGNSGWHEFELTPVRRHIKWHMFRARLRETLLTSLVDIKRRLCPNSVI